MLTTLKITRLYIDKVVKVEVEKLQNVEELEFSQRTITVWNEEGDRYEMVLEAASAKSLEFVDGSEWLTPKVYQPQEE